MKILIISDTHKNINNVVALLTAQNDFTHMLHLGDNTCDAEDLSTLFPNITTYYVRGNNDLKTFAPHELNLELGNIKLFMTHGHYYNVKSSVLELAKKGKSMGVDIALFGHTHSFYDEVIDGVRLLNPSDKGYIIITNDKIEVCKF